VFCSPGLPSLTGMAVACVENDLRPMASSFDEGLSSLLGQAAGTILPQLLVNAFVPPSGDNCAISVDKQKEKSKMAIQCLLGSIPLVVIGYLVILWSEKKKIKQIRPHGDHSTVC